MWKTPPRNYIKLQTVRTRLFRARHLRADLERKFASRLGGMFPFLRARCARITARVLQRLD